LGYGLRFLHVGFSALRKNRTLHVFASSDREEVTVDIDASVRPDIADKLPDLAKVASDSFDAVYASHCIEC